MEQEKAEYLGSRPTAEKADLQIFIVSDFTAETASSLVRAAIRQYEDGKIALRRFRYIDNVDKMRNVCIQAKEANAVIACTLVSGTMRGDLQRVAAESGVKIVELFGPLLEVISDRLGVPAAGLPGASHKMDAEYFRRVKAIEYASTCDDGANPKLLPDADLVIMGVSRTCKTPLSMYLANKGIRTANVPLVPELVPPEELFSLPYGRVVALTINPDTLRSIRRDRLKLLGLDPDDASYAKEDRVQAELSYANKIAERVHAKVVNVTGRAIEETAGEIMDYLRERGCPAVTDIH